MCWRWHTPRHAACVHCESDELGAGTVNANLIETRLLLKPWRISPRATAGLRFAIREAVLAIVAAPIGLWGRLTHFVPIQLARRLALRNVTARDEPAMRTLVVGLLLVLAAYIVQTAAVAFLIGGWWALAFFMTLVPSASSDLRYGDRTRRARDRARAYFAFRRDLALQAALAVEADAIRQDAFTLERLAADPWIGTGTGGS